MFRSKLRRMLASGVFLTVLVYSYIYWSASPTTIVEKKRQPNFSTDSKLGSKLEHSSQVPVPRGRNNSGGLQVLSKKTVVSTTTGSPNRSTDSKLGSKLVHSSRAQDTHGRNNSGAQQILSKKTVISTTTRPADLSTNFELDLNLEHSSWVQDMYMKNDSGYIQVETKSTYLMSAFSSNKTGQSRWDLFSLIGWEETDEVYKCCFLFKDLKVQFNKMAYKTLFHYREAALHARQFLCNRTGVDNNGHVVGVTLASLNQSCPTNHSSYLNVKYLYRPVRKNFCINMKDIHGKKDAVDMIEWFEFQKLFGVERIFAYPVNNLNREAVKVLLYYQQTGLVEIVPYYHMPEKDKHPREFHTGDPPLKYNDQQVAVFDSSERLRECWYAAVIDTDEFITPTNKSITSYVQLMDELLRQDPNRVGFTFLDHMHVTSWGAVDASSELMIGRYLNHSEPMKDCPKQAFVPARMAPGGKTIHGVTPDTGYSSAKLVPASTAVLKHYRTFRWAWRDLPEMKRITDTSVLPIVDAILPNIRRIRNKTGLQGHHLTRIPQ